MSVQQIPIREANFDTQSSLCTSESSTELKGLHEVEMRSVHSTQYLDTAEKQQHQHHLERKLVRKLDLTLMPALSVLYLFSYLDRGNIGNARLGSLEHDLRLEGSDFYNALSIFFVGYVVFQVPASIAVKLFKPSLLIGLSTILWGVSSSSIAGTQGFAGIMTARFFLGCFEAGVSPCLPLLISFWYQRHEMALRISIFFGASTIAGAFGGVFAWAIIGHMDQVAGMASWRWLFLIEGLPTVVIGILCLFFLPNYPETANTTWWLTPSEKDMAIERTKLHTEADDTSFSQQQLWAALKDPHTWFFAFIYSGIHVCLASYTLFSPTIVKGMGFQSLEAQLLTIPPYVAACVCVLVISWYSDKTRQRAFSCLVCLGMTVVGYIFLLAGIALPVKYAGAILVASGVYPLIPLCLSWISNNNLGHTKRGVAIAFSNAMSQCFSILGSNLYRDDDAPDYHRGHYICLGFALATFILVIILRILFKRENLRRDEIQRNNGEQQSGSSPGKTPDLSPSVVLRTEYNSRNKER
ncbi:major facilitator superfamily transporter [Dichotomocladium elegans]|nr:major facilitator superfamily transporter [Dichotomocladium elegans]